MHCLLRLITIGLVFSSCAAPLYAQLKEFEITEDVSRFAGVIFRDYEDQAAVIVASSIINLRFESNLGIVADKSEPDNGMYRLILLPRRQILTVKAVGYREGRIQVPSLEARDVLYYSIEPKEEPDVVGTGTLVIETTPPGATITTFGVLQTNMTTPNTIEDQQVGSYRLVIEMENYAPLDTVVVVQQGEILTRSFTLTPAEDLPPVPQDGRLHVTLAQEPGSLIENARIQKDEGRVIVDYDLVGDAKKYKVALLLSRDGGLSFEPLPKTINGDVGKGVLPGTGKQLTWAADQDFPQGSAGENYQLRVTAKKQGGKGLLFAVLGGLAAGGGTAAALLLGGSSGDDWPPPPGKPPGN